MSVKYRTHGGSTYRSEVVAIGLGDGQGTSVSISIRETIWSHIKRRLKAVFQRGQK